jgi:hypothetical protein
MVVAFPPFFPFFPKFFANLQSSVTRNPYTLYKE